MKTTIILGSVRNGRQGIKLANYIKDQIKDSEVELIDPKEWNLELLEDRYPDMKEPSEKYKKLSKKLMESDGFIFVSAEYNSSIPPALKNLIDHFTVEFYKKPASVVSYSMGSFAGLIAASHLKISLINLGAIIVPKYLPVPTIQNVFDEQGNLIDKEYERRVKELIDETIWFEKLMQKSKEI